MTHTSTYSHTSERTLANTHSTARKRTHDVYKRHGMDVQSKSKAHPYLHKIHSHAGRRGEYFIISDFSMFGLFWGLLGDDYLCVICHQWPESFSTAAPWIILRLWEMSCFYISGLFEINRRRRGLFSQHERWWDTVTETQTAPTDERKRKSQSHPHSLTGKSLDLVKVYMSRPATSELVNWKKNNLPIFYRQAKETKWWFQPLKCQILLLFLILH